MDMVNLPESRDLSTTSPRRAHVQDSSESAPRKKSRKSTIMDALRRGMDQPSGQANPSRQLSTTATAPVNTRSTSPRFWTHARSPGAPVPTPSVSSTGLPFYTHTEPLSSSSLPALPAAHVHYFREVRKLSETAIEEANAAISRMIDRFEPPPGSRWRGVVGFDMEWTVGIRGTQAKTGLIQIADDKGILLIQVSSMKSFPSKLKDLVTSATILKVGVNIGGDMRKLCKDFGPSYAGRGVLELSQLARAVDVGLVGTKKDDLDSNRASIGVGVRTTSNSLTSVSADSNQALDSDSEGEAADESEPVVVEGAKSNTNVEGKGSTGDCIRPGKQVISLARLTRRYLGRELAKGSERTSNWDLSLSLQQRQYAANDAHAGLALYHALRAVHSRAIVEGVIPVPSPAPWQENSISTSNSLAGDSLPPKYTTHPPPFRASSRTTTTTEPNVVPVEQLQDLTASQLESLMPWSTCVRDMHAEVVETRAAVRTKRTKEGVDINGRGEAVVAAEKCAVNKPAAAAIVPAGENATTNVKALPKPPGTMTSDNTTSQPVPKPAPKLPSSGLIDTAAAPSKGMARVLARRQAFQDNGDEALGKKWPPTRAFNTRPFSSAPSVSSEPVSEPKPAPEENTSLSRPLATTRPSPPARSVSSPLPGTAPRSSSQHLRAYLLWHNQQLSLTQICVSMRSARHPLGKTTVIGYIIQALQADESLPFEAPRLKALVDLDLTHWVRENYREFLESKVGPLDPESQ